MSDQARRYVEDEVKAILADLQPGDLVPAKAAVQACEALLSRCLSLPHLSSSGSGGLLCEWRSNARDLLASVSPTGIIRLHQFARHGSAAAVFVVSPSDSELAAAVRWFATGSLTPAALPPTAGDGEQSCESGVALVV